MNVILYMAMTSNGYIAKENNDTPWSEEECEGYHSFVKKRGNVVVGRRTYELMRDGGEFEKLGNPFTVVVTHTPSSAANETTVFVSSPRAALKVLKEKGFSEAVVGGGGMLNASFLKEGLLDELYLDVDPLVFGKGIKLFADTDVEAKLELMGVENLSKNTIRLHYKVLGIGGL